MSVQDLLQIHRLDVLVSVHEKSDHQSLNSSSVKVSEDLINQLLINQI